MIDKNEPMQTPSDKNAPAQVDRVLQPPANQKEGWTDFRGKLRGKYAQLSEGDLEAYKTRDRAALVGFVHQRVGGERSMIERDIDTYSRDTRFNW